jgi:hypothetical protein
MNVVQHWTSILVGRDGEVYDLAVGERAPDSKDGKTYHIWFGQTCTKKYCDMLKALPNNESRVKQIKREMGD